jgi:hypothetical protein
MLAFWSLAAVLSIRARLSSSAPSATSWQAGGRRASGQDRAGQGGGSNVKTAAAVPLFVPLLLKPP